MIVYELPDDGGYGGSSYFETLTEAKEARKEWRMGEGEIEKLWLIDLPPRALAVRLLNGASFVAKREVVA